ncbi:MAG: thiamine pyrophosphate-dependent enzyme [Slackia sp.]|nr:thiamine pyrophosphate-dependent enzyme [Slackia sp.]
MVKKLLMGNEAFACAALEAGVGVAAGYPGTPSSEVIETIAARVADGSATGVHVEWSTNEKAALEVLAGASYAGARTLFTCKQVGLNVASDALMSLNYVGIEGGCVLFVADDPGPISSQTEQDTRRFAAFAKVPVFDPADIEQGMEMMRAAYDLSERYRTPVIVRPTTRVCHSSTFVEVEEGTAGIRARGFEKDDSRWVIFPARSHRGHLEVNERLAWIEAEFSGARAQAIDGVVAESLAASGFSFENGHPRTRLDAAKLLPAAAADLGLWRANGAKATNGMLAGAGDGPRACAKDADACERGSLACAKEDAACADAAATASAACADDAGAAVSSRASVLPPCDLSRFNPIEQGGRADRSPRLGIVCGGVSTAYAREALCRLAEQAREQGECLPAYRFMQVGTPFPFPMARADEFACGLDRIIVFEELDSVIEDELVRLMGMRAAAGADVASVRGRRALAAAAGELSVDGVLDVLERDFLEEALRDQGCSDEERAARLAAFDARRSEEARKRAGRTLQVALPARPPVLCAGCPHRGAFYAAKRALKKLRVRGVLSGDIGCYTLGNAAPLDAVDTCLCMGAGITMAQGLGVVEPDVRQLAFVGDSTFFASGLTGVANAAYNGHDITICVLDNSTTAMTGGQPHPGTGRTLMGAQAEGLSIESALTALGVTCIEHANPHHLEESVDAVMRAVEYRGVSAVVFRAPCVDLVKSAVPASIDADRCTGCKKCITSIGCPAIGFDGSVATLDEALCIGCGLCAAVCPFGVIEAPASAREEQR